MLVSAAFGTSTATAAPVSQPYLPQAQTIEQYVEAYFADTPIMIDIARCESRFHQFDKNGEAYRGEINHEDIGVMQINEHYHGTEAEKMNIDVTYNFDNVSIIKGDGINPAITIKMIALAK